MTTAPQFQPALTRFTRRAAFTSLFLLLFTALLLLAAYFIWQIALHTDDLRTECLVAEIVTGIGATSCLAGIMHFLDLPLLGGRAPWYLRWPLLLNKRLLLAAELATTALTLAAAFILLFGLKIPGAPHH
jgi:hypothetical protein